MTRHGQPQTNGGHILRTVIAIEVIPFEHGHKRIGTLDCGHKRDLTFATSRKVGSRTRCQECR